MFKFKIKENYFAWLAQFVGCREACVPDSRTDQHSQNNWGEGAFFALTLHLQTRQKKVIQVISWKHQCLRLTFLSFGIKNLKLEANKIKQFHSSNISYCERNVIYILFESEMLVNRNRIDIRAGNLKSRLKSPLKETLLVKVT